MARKGASEIPTIDCEMITVSPSWDPTIEFGLTTANQIEVEPQTEDIDAVRLIVKGKLLAQKKQKKTIVGHEITLHDNVFNATLVKMLQGGTIEYWTNENKSASSYTETLFGVAKYTPPEVGSDVAGDVFTLNAYSAQYDAAGEIVQYEKISYPNCTGVPVAFASEDDSFRAPEYTIDSAAKNGQAPYEISYVDSLPILTGFGVNNKAVTLTLTECKANIPNSVGAGTYRVVLTPNEGHAFATKPTAVVTIGDGTQNYEFEIQADGSAVADITIVGATTITAEATQ